MQRAEWLFTSVLLLLAAYRLTYHADQLLPGCTASDHIPTERKRALD